jgi:hypothetical protein
VAARKPKAETVVIYTGEKGRRYPALVLKSWVSGQETYKLKKPVSEKGIILVDLVYVHEEESNGKDGTLTIENSVPFKRSGMKGRYWEYPKKLIRVS